MPTQQRNEWQLRKVKIKDILMEKSIYSRSEGMGGVTPWYLPVAIYADQMRFGDKFPPLKIGEYDNKLYLVGGAHRLGALKKIGKQTAEAVVKHYQDFDQMIIDGIEDNTTHGVQLSVQDRVWEIDRLTQMGLSDERIARVLHMADIDRVRSLRERMLTTSEGEKIYLKKPVYEAVKSVFGSTKNLNEKQIEQAVELNRKQLGRKNAQAILTSVVSILNAELLDIEDPKILKLCQEINEKLYDLLKASGKLEEEAPVQKTRRKPVR